MSRAWRSSISTFALCMMIAFWNSIIKQNFLLFERQIVEGYITLWAWVGYQANGRSVIIYNCYSDCAKQSVGIIIQFYVHSLCYVTYVAAIFQCVPFHWVCVYFSRLRALWKAVGFGCEPRQLAWFLLSPGSIRFAMVYDRCSHVTMLNRQTQCRPLGL